MISTGKSTGPVSVVAYIHIASLRSELRKMNDDAHAAFHGNGGISSKS